MIGMPGSNNNKEAMLYYLFMMADGEVSNNEKKIFNTICKELEIDNDVKKEVIKKSKELVDDTSDILSIIIDEKIDERLVGYGGAVGLELLMAVAVATLSDVSNRIRMVWNLVNLGYSDSFFSDEEKKIVNYLVDKWSVNPEVYQELVDTADTILALEKQKEWIISTFPEGSTRNKRKRNVDKTIKQLLDDVKLTIEEAAM